MVLVRRFEDLRVWQEARRLAALAFEATAQRSFRRDRSLVDQLRRATVSAMNNIAEGFDSGSAAEFGRFLRYAVRSVSEVQSCLYVALDRKYVSVKQFDDLYESARRVKSLASSLLRRTMARSTGRRPKEGMVREATNVWLYGRPDTSAPPHLRTSARF